MRHLLIDLETAPLANVADYLDPVEAAKNLKDPEKIKADIEKRQREQREDCGLDWNLNRIVCAGLWGDDETEPSVLVVPDEAGERVVLETIANRLSNPRPLILGFCVRRFDVPVILQRARYLGVRMPRISLKRYDNPHITDVYDALTFDEQPCTAVMRRTLDSFCRRFGIDVQDTHSGKHVPELIAAGEWDAVKAHCLADLRKTRLLAERIGVLDAVAA